MPIPVSVTGWSQGVSESAAELETSGPFARLATAQDAPAASEAAQPRAADGKAAVSVTDAVCNVSGLTFHHCGLGTRRAL